MKRAILAPLLFLSACVPMRVEGEVAACPAAGLAQVVFTAAPPPGGDVIAPLQGKDGALSWQIPDSGAYITCVYDSGFTRAQRLPGAVTSCALGAGMRLSCASSL